MPIVLRKRYSYCLLAVFTRQSVNVVLYLDRVHTASHDAYMQDNGTTAGDLTPVGHFKIPHLWSPKIPQAGRVDYQLTEGFCASRVAASLSR